jgi:hypothetical protein
MPKNMMVGGSRRPLTMIPTANITCRNLRGHQRGMSEVRQAYRSEGSSSQWWFQTNCWCWKGLEIHPSLLFVLITMVQIFVRFETLDSSQNALKALAGRKFADRTVVCTYFSEVGTLFCSLPPSLTVFSQENYEVGAF